MIILGLTGSIGMGKSTAAAHLRKSGIAVFDADAAVHDLYRGAAVAKIAAAFPGVALDVAIDRAKLSAALIAAPQRFAELEAIVHPLVRAAEREFLHEQARKRADIAVLEIPLLFESGANALVDAVIVVSSNPDRQRERVMQRPGMTPEKLKSILARQMDDADKKARADFVVDTNGPIADGEAQIDAILHKVRKLTPKAYVAHWASAIED